MDTTLSFSSISEIHNLLVKKEYPPRVLHDYIVAAHDEWKSGKAEKLAGSENDYHNLSVELSRNDCAPFAASVAALGLETYPMSTDLLADLIKYSQETGDSASCKLGLKKLKSIDRQYWTWRTFVFVIDFLKDSLSSSSGIDEYKENAKEAATYIEEFKHYIPYEERAYVAEAELCLNHSDHQGAIHALEQGIKEIAVAPQCCMKLADLCLECGQYDQVETYARKGILAALQDQPTVSIGYLYYLLAMAMDAKRILCRQGGDIPERSCVQETIDAYKTADKLFVNEGRSTVAYRNTIRARLIIIKTEEGVSNDEEPEDANKYDLAKLLKLHDILENKNES